jgi:hypothetical protein
MKRVEGKATFADFDLENTNWTNPADDDLINLNLYKTELFWENMIHSLITGEHIPSAVWCEARLCGEFGINPATLWDYLERGSDIIDKDLEYEEIEVTDEEVDQFIAENPDIISVLDMALSLGDRRRSEIDELNKMFEAQ